MCCKLPKNHENLEIELIMVLGIDMEPCMLGKLIHCIDSFRMIGNFPVVLNFNWLFFKLNRLICN